LLKQIKYFQSVVEEDSFTKAADSHFISQSAISQQIRSLEAELGVTLLTRKIVALS
jgi:DNA-binding transcriptional LysR family regulator